MTRFKTAIADLKNQDIYSLMLFLLFKLQDNPKYSTLSELIYILGEDDFLKLCEYFGGLTIQIPKVEDLEILINALLLYQYINLEKKTEAEACRLLGCKSKVLLKSKEAYNSILTILNNYGISL